MQPISENQQKPAVSRKTPNSNSLTVQEYVPPLFWSGRPRVKRETNKQGRDVLKGG